MCAAVIVHPWDCCSQTSTCFGVLVNTRTHQQQDTVSFPLLICWASVQEAYDKFCNRTFLMLHHFFHLHLVLVLILVLVLVHPGAVRCSSKRVNCCSSLGLYKYMCLLNCESDQHLLQQYCVGFYKDEMLRCLSNKRVHCSMAHSRVVTSQNILCDPV